MVENLGEVAAKAVNQGMLVEHDLGRLIFVSFPKFKKSCIKATDTSATLLHAPLINPQL